MIRKVLVVLIFVLLPTGSFAQSKQVGRLSDGRAYRVDQSGMRLIDQVAELEVTNDDLKRQVVALEDEISDKNKVIESLRAGVKVPSEEKLREQDLLGKTASGLPKAAVVQSCDNSELEALKLKLQSLSSNNNDQQLAEEKQTAEKLAAAERKRSEFLTQENSSIKDKLALLNAEKNQLSAQLNSTQSSLTKTQDSERTELAIRIAKSGQEKSALIEEIEDLKSSITKLNRENKSYRENANLAIKAENDNSNQDAQLQQEIALLKEQLVESQREVLKLKEQTSSVIATRSRMVEAVPPAAQTVNPEAKNLVAAIQSKIMKRKSLLDHVSKSGKGIAISASNLVTSNGLSLDRLRQAVNGGDTDATVIKGLHEISNILDGDISTASRLAK